MPFVSLKYHDFTDVTLAFDDYHPSEMSPMWKILQIQEIFRSINRHLITNQKLVLSVIRPKGTILPKYTWTTAMPIVPTRLYCTEKVHTPGWTFIQ